MSNSLLAKAIKWCRNPIDMVYVKEQLVIE